MSDQGLVAQGTFTLYVLQEGGSPVNEQADFQLEAPGVEGYIVGRSDGAGSYQPDVDLSPYNAQKLGISRRHAALVRYRDVIHLIDLGSTNGTYVNDRRLPPHVAYAINPRDHLSFANLVLSIE